MTHTHTQKMTDTSLQVAHLLVSQGNLSTDELIK